MPTLESAIDDVYKVPLEEFVSARTTLAKSLKGAAAKGVRGLSKPTVVAWAVNQVYWHARTTYDSVLKTGEKLRDAQIAALKGRAADPRAANAAHRAAVGEAVKAATRLASSHGINPDAEALARMFEAVSVTATPPEPHGRFTKPLRPAGFEALVGVEIAHVARTDARRHVVADSPVRGGRLPPPVEASASPHASADRANPLGKAGQPASEGPSKGTLVKATLAAERRKQDVIKKAQDAVSGARAVEARAREAWDRAKHALEHAERALEKARD